MTIHRRGLIAALLGEHIYCAFEHGKLAPRDVPILSGRVSGRTPADVEDGIFDLARGTAIAVPPGSAAHQTLKGLLGLEVDLVMRVKH